MEFHITRTSDVYNDTKPKPCDGAYLKNNIWCIKITSLEKLLQLSKQEGELVIENDGFHNSQGIPSIEIYDDWRE